MNIKHIVSISLATMATMTLCACGSKSEDKSQPSDFYLTYEAFGTCSTGLQTIKSSSEAAAKADMCEALKDNSRNAGCAVAQREQLFRQQQCPGGWPQTTTNGATYWSSKSYSHDVNGCSTGLHFFSAGNQHKTMELYCQALLNDQLNQNCARSDREQDFDEAKCGEILTF